ncbi:MAG: OmpA family protein [Bacteroidota bacterium]
MRILTILLCLLCVAAGPALAQNGGSRPAKPKTEETSPKKEETEVTPPPVVPPPVGSSSNTSNPRPPRTTRSGGGQPLTTWQNRPWKVRPGFYVGLRGDLGGASGISVDPLGGPQLLEVGSLDENGEPFVDAEGNEVTTSATTNWGVNLGYRFASQWGIQAGYDLSRVVYTAINNEPFASSRIGGDLNAWELPYTQQAVHFGVERAFRGPLKLAFLFVRLGGRAEWYRSTANNVAPGTSDWVEDGTGALWENTFAEGPVYVIAPEMGWHLGKRFQLSFAYHFPLSDLATQTYTQYLDGEVVGTNQVSVNSQQFLMRLQWDVFHLGAPKRRSPRPRPQPVAPPATPDPPVEEVVTAPQTSVAPTIAFDCSQTDAYVLQKVHFKVSQAVFLDDAAAAEELDALVQILQNCADIKVEVAGHTDNRGLERKNLALSHDRAEVVREYLASHGIRRRRIKAEGYGSQYPVASNQTEEGRQQNRRVEIRIIR